MTMLISRHVRSVWLAVIFAAAYSIPAGAEAINVEVESSIVERDKRTNEQIIVVTLSPDGRTAFQNFTERNIGRELEIRLGTTVLLKATLREKILGGVINVSPKLSDDEIKKIAAQLTRGAMITLEDKLD